MAGGFEGLHSFVDAVLARLNYLIGILLVPSVTPLCFLVRKRKVWGGASPRLRVILGEFNLVLGHDIGVAVEDDESG